MTRRKLKEQTEFEVRFHHIHLRLIHAPSADAKAEFRFEYNDYEFEEDWKTFKLTNEEVSILAHLFESARR